MKNIRKLLSAVMIVAMLTPIAAFADDTVIKDDRFILKVKSYLMTNYDGEISEEEMVQGAVDGMFNVLDKHTIYMEAPESKEFLDEVGGKLYGIGAQIHLRDGQVIITGLLEDSPAGRSGVLPGDIIMEIDGERVGFVKKLSPMIDKIKGEKGTPVKITVNRDGQILEFEIIRDEIKINPVSYKTIGKMNNIGYLKISDFNSNVSEEVKEAVEELKDENLEKLVLDLRGNPGGGLADVVKVAQDFVPKGLIVSAKYKNGREINFMSKGGKKFEDVVVLIDNGSASASEILAGAIQDSKSGVLVGQKSYGKGTIQTVVELKNKDSMKITVGKYYLPTGRTIDHTGLVPEYEIERFDKELELDQILKLDVQKEIERGDSGVNVVALQQRMKSMGYGVEITGMFDDQTATALGILQSGYGLDRDEVGDIETLRKVNQKFSEYLLSENNDMQLKKAIEILSE